MIVLVASMFTINTEPLLVCELFNLCCIYLCWDLRVMSTELRINQILQNVDFVVLIYCSKLKVKLWQKDCSIY